MLRKVFRQGLAGLIAMLGLALSTQQSDAAPLPIVQTGLYNPGMGYMNTHADVDVGYQFKINASGEAITALGIWDEGQNGLAAAHFVGLWDGVGNLLASVIIPAGTGSTLLGEYRYLNLTTPYALTNGATYTLGANDYGAAGAADGYLAVDGNWPPTFDPLITGGDNLYNYPGTLNSYPVNNVGLPGLAYLGPNALFAPVPEPSSMVLALFGLVGLFVARRRGTH